MPPAFSNNYISLSTVFQYLRGIWYGFHAIGSHVVGISISNRLVLPTSVEDLDIMLSNSFSSKEESLSLASCRACASCIITDCLLELLFSGWKLDSGGMDGSSVRLFLMSSWDFSILVQDMLLTSILSISIGFNVANTVTLGTQTLIVCSVGYG